MIGRGIEKSAIFRKDGDRIDFLTRVAVLCQEEVWKIYAFALMDNHFHLLIRTISRRVLIRSLGDWSQVVSSRRKGIQSAHDDRILGSSDFVSGLLREADEKEKETLRLSVNVHDLDSLAKEIVKREGVDEKTLRAATRKAKAVRARRLFCQLAVKKLKYYGAAARYLGMTTSAVNRSANAQALPEIKNYL